MVAVLDWKANCTCLTDQGFVHIHSSCFLILNLADNVSVGCGTEDVGIIIENAFARNRARRKNYILNAKTKIFLVVKEIVPTTNRLRTNLTRIY